MTQYTLTNQEQSALNKQLSDVIDDIYLHAKIDFAPVFELLEQGADSNTPGTQFKHLNALKLAAHQEKKELVHTLVKIYGANINIAAKGELSVLGCAIESRNEETVQMVLDYGANPTLMGEHGLTPLMKTVSLLPSETMVKLLLAALTPKDILVTNDQGQTAIDLALALLGYSSTVQAMLMKADEGKQAMSDGVLEDGENSALEDDTSEDSSLDDAALILASLRDYESYHMQKDISSIKSILAAAEIVYNDDEELREYVLAMVSYVSNRPDDAPELQAPQNDLPQEDVPDSHILGATLDNF